MSIGVQGCLNWPVKVPFPLYIKLIVSDLRIRLFICTALERDPPDCEAVTSVLAASTRTINITSYTGRPG